MENHQIPNSRCVSSVDRTWPWKKADKKALFMPSFYEEMPDLSHCDELAGIVLSNDTLQCFLQSHK